MLTNELVIQLVKSALGYPNVALEVTDAHILNNLKVAITLIAPYYSGTSFVDSAVVSRIIDLDDGIQEVVHVYESAASSPNIEEQFFPGFGLTADYNNMIDMAVSAYRSNEFRALISQNFRRLGNKLYLDDYPGSYLTLEVIKDINTITDVTDELALAWVLKYTLALTKITLGNIRRKFAPQSAPFETDGQAMADEGRTDKDTLESQLKDLQYGFFYIEK